MFIDVTAVTSENIDLPPQDFAVSLTLYLHYIRSPKKDGAHGKNSQYRFGGQ